jgi:hypothetical protein
VIDSNFQFSNNYSTNDIREIGNATGDSDLTFGLECRKPFSEMQAAEHLYAQVSGLLLILRFLLFFSLFWFVFFFYYYFDIFIFYFFGIVSPCSLFSLKFPTCVRMVRTSHESTQRNCH